MMDEDYEGCTTCEYGLKSFKFPNCKSCLADNNESIVSGWKRKESAVLDKIIDPRD